MSRNITTRWGSTSTRAVVTAIAALICTVSVDAQTTTATLRGRVRVLKQPGKSVSGALLTAVNSATGYVHQAVARTDGSFSLTLDPSVYTITASAPGYAKTRKVVRVQIGQALDLDFEVAALADASAVVEVTATQDLLELKTSEVATNISTEQLEFLPQGRRSFLDFAAMAPGLRLSTDESNQSFSSGGQTSQKVNIFVDGLSYKNDVIAGGVMGQDSSKGNPFPLSAVQEVRVLTENYKAEYQKASAAIITAVTKSGTNEVHGDVYSYFQDKGLVSQNAWDKKQGVAKAAYSRWQTGASVGGPIIKDKLHYFVSFENVRQDTENNVYIGWRKDIAPTALLATLKTYEGTFTSPFRSNLFFGKVDWQIDTAQQLEFNVNVRKESDKRSFGSQTAYSRGEDMKVDVNSFSAKHRLTTANWVNEAMVSFQHFRWNPKPITSGVGYEYVDLMTVGGNGGGQDIKQDRISLRDDFSYVGLTGHAIKMGVNLDFLSYDVAKYFDTEPTFHYYYGTGQDSTTDWSMPAYAILRVGNSQFKTNNKEFGWYVQDDWKVTPRLSLNLGLRWDYESDMFNNDYVTPAQEISDLKSIVPSNYFTDGTKRKPFYGAFQPRLGFSYDVTGQGKTVVFGGLGRYYDREAFNNSLDEKFREQSRLYTFLFTNDPANNPTRIAWSSSYASRAGLLNLLSQGTAGSYEAFFLNNDQKVPYSDQFSLGVKHTQGAWNYALTYTNVASKNNLTWVYGDLDSSGNQKTLPSTYSRVLLSASTRTWYNAYYVTIDKPYTDVSGWGAGVAYTLSSTDKTGTDLFSLPSGTYDPMKRHRATGSERSRLVTNGILKLPLGLRLSGIITLGSGPSYDIYDYSVYNDWSKVVVRAGEGTPKKESFIFKAWAYRSVDLKLEKEFKIGKTRLGLIAEGINVFNYANWTYSWNSGAIKPNGEVNPYFGQPEGGALNPRRWQFGMTFKF